MKKTQTDLSGLPFEIETLQDLVNKSEAAYGDTTAVQYFESRELKLCTYQKLAADVRRLSNAFVQMSIGNGHIALIGQNSYRWIVTFLAVCCSGRIAVLVDANASVQELQRFLARGEASCVLCDEKCIKKVVSACSQMDQAIPIYDMNLPEGKLGEISLADRAENKFLVKMQPQFPAAIMFTSGSSGVSKGVVLTHKNLVSDVKVCQLLTNTNNNDAIFTVLPPQHAFQLTAGLLTPLYVGAVIGIGRGIKYIKEDFLVYRPTFMVVVPIIVKSLYRQIMRTVERSQKTKLVNRAKNLSSLLLRLHIDLRPFLFKEIRATFGGRLNSIVCGGAHLEATIVEEMNAIGLPVMTGYGITECSPVVCCNMVKRQKPGSVGMPTPLCEVREFEGELLIRGDIVAQGYYGMPDQTEEVFVDGWFHTGDLGHIDQDGFVYVSGRKKNLIVLSNGENVSPEELEMLLQNIPGVNEAMIQVSYAGELDYLSAIIYPDVEYMRSCGEDAYEMHLRQAVRETNQTLSSFKQIKSVKISREPAQHTATGKLQRNCAEPKNVREVVGI